jgi:acyl-coenzyme A thioesterase PaaI-like protein
MMDVFADLQASVPLVRTLGLEEVEVSAERAVLRLPDLTEQRNHVGGPHAGAMFTLGESASGAVVLTHFSATLDRATPLAVSASIHYMKLAFGPVTATAVLLRPAGDILAELDNGKRPEFEVGVEIVDGEGVVTAQMTVLWTLRPNRSN